MKFQSKGAMLPECDMTPMIDMVFQLIAFFMIITNFEQTQADERVKLPMDELARPPKTKRDKELVINIGFVRTSEGDRVGAGVPVIFYPNAPKPLTIGEFKTPLQLEKQNFADTGVNPKDVTVILRADSEVPTGMVQDLIKMSQEAGFEKFALKAQQEQLE
jgi:biopolymer transport protein ExbD